ncbi:hypothetical protein ACFYXC_19305 [Streptomyces sp. NPDC002701]|uniref:hypothetical protein n=1 Tax=Streptomyces sp. NPDC002701 TaxID=3364661 RepID=UPI00367F9ABB
MWRGGHDTVFSVDAVLPLYDGTSAWVRKEDNLLVGTPRGRWFPAEPALLPFLDRLGLYDERAHPRPAAARPTPGVAADARSGSGSGTGSGASSASVPASTSAPAGAYWWWTGPGLAAGTLLGALGALRLGRRRPTPGRTGPLHGGPPRPPDRSPTA